MPLELPTEPGDLMAWHAAWAAATARGAWRVESLGEAFGHPVWIGERPAGWPCAPRLLVATALHGDEVAGPWAVLQWLLDTPPSVLDAVHLTVLPLVNTTGFRAGTRLNEAGENPNRGLGPHAGGQGPSVEGRVLLAHAARLQAASLHGVLAAHEDLQRPFAYVYTFEPGNEPGDFSRTFAALGAARFPLPPDGEVDGHPVRGGIIHNRHDGSLESWLSSTGTPRAVCTETPGRAPLTARVEAQVAWLGYFVDQAVAAASVG